MFEESFVCNQQQHTDKCTLSNGEDFLFVPTIFVRFSFRTFSFRPICGTIHPLLACVLYTDICWWMCAPIAPLSAFLGEGDMQSHMKAEQKLLAKIMVSPWKIYVLSTIFSHHRRRKIHSFEKFHSYEKCWLSEKYIITNTKWDLGCEPMFECSISSSHFFFVV